MSMRHFWEWKMRKNIVHNEDGSDTVEKEQILFLDGPIASDEDSWFDDNVTPAMFREELDARPGDVTVWINSPGGDCFAAAQIFAMLKEHDGKITVKIDGIAASAASVIAMAGDTVLMSPVSLMMIHDPSTLAIGNAAEMQQAINILNTVKESIINAYALKSSLSRDEISQLMTDETWMYADEAMARGFCDGILYRDENGDDIVEDRAAERITSTVMTRHFSMAQMTNCISDKLAARLATNTPPAAPTDEAAAEEPVIDPADTEPTEPTAGAEQSEPAEGTDTQENAENTAQAAEEPTEGNQSGHKVEELLKRLEMAKCHF